MVLELKAQAREITGRKVNQIRKTGSIPAVLYGRGIKSINLSVDAREFGRVFKQAGETSLVALLLGGKKHNVLIHDLARHPLSGDINHIDFFEVKMDEKIKAKVQLVFIGESEAVKAEDGVLVKAIQEVEIEAFPQDLPKEIAVDISSLKTFEDKIHVKDLKVGNSVRVLAAPEEMVVLVAPPRSEKEMEELEGKPVEAIEEVKVVGEEKKEKEAEEIASTEQAKE